MLPSISEELARQAQPTNSPSLVGDLFKAPFRGVANAASGVYGLADWATGDLLPDMDVNPLGTSDTLAGSLLEGVTQFVAGFLPITGALGKVSKLGTFSKNAAGAALTDFTVFDGNDPRLSNLIQSVPGLANPITGALEADPDDPELIGRLKNVLEGAGIDFAIGGVAAGLKKLMRGDPVDPDLIQKTILDLTRDRESLAELRATEREAFEIERVSRGSRKLTDQIRDNVLLEGSFKPGELRVLDEFTESFAPRVFDDLRLHYAPARDLPATYDFGTRVLTITDAALEDGRGLYTMLHELAHAIEDYVDPAIWSKVVKQYEATKRQAIRQDPTLPGRLQSQNYGPGEYRYADPREYFAEMVAQSAFEGAQPTLREFGAADELLEDIPVTDGLVKTSRSLWQKMIHAVRRTQGADAVKEALDDLRANWVDQRRMNLGETPEARLARRAEEADESRRYLEDIGDRMENFLRASIDPRDPNALPSLTALPADDINLSMLADGLIDAASLARVVEQRYAKVLSDMPGREPRSFEQQATEAVTELIDILGIGHKDQPSFLAGLQDRDLLVSIKDEAEADTAALRKLNARVQARKFLIHNQGQIVADRIKDVLRNPDRIGDYDIARLREELDMYKKNIGYYRGTVAEQARGLGAHRMIIPDVGSGDLASFLASNGGRKQVIKDLENFAKHMEKGDAAGVKALTVPRYRILRDMFLDYWQNSILSGLRTFAVNGSSGGMMAAYRPLELAAGGLAGKISRGRLTPGVTPDSLAEVAEDAMNELVAARYVAMDAIHYAVETFTTGTDFLLPKSRTADLASSSVGDSQISGANVQALLKGSPMELQHDGGLYNAIDWIGKNVVSLPNRGLGATDQAWKQIAYRQVVFAQGVREARKAGAADPISWARKYVDDFMVNGEGLTKERIYREAEAKAKAEGVPEEMLEERIKELADEFIEANPDKMYLAQNAKNASETVTHTAALKEGSVSKWFQKLPMAHPEFKLVLPFVRTPVNLLTFAWKRTGEPAQVMARHVLTMPLPKNAQNLLRSRGELATVLQSSDPRQAAEALGRLSAAAMFLTVGVGMASAGRITGRGPSDPATRKMMREAGWQPYSIFTGDDPFNPTYGEYVSFARLDPFATILGLFADAYDYARNDIDAEGSQAESLMQALLIAATNNFTNKSYVQGIANITAAISDTERSLATVMNRYAASLVPNIAGQAVGSDLGLVGEDPYMREVRTMLDGVMSRTPGLSDDLPVQYNMLGEPVRRVEALGAGLHSIANAFVPIMVTEVSDNQIKQEFRRLGHGFSAADPVRGGVDLRTIRVGDETAYEVFSRLQGEVKIGGLTLQQALKREIDSPRYQRASPVSSRGVESPRIQYLNSIVAKYRREAYRETARRSDDLSSALDERAETIRSRRLGILQQLSEF